MDLNKQILSRRPIVIALIAILVVLIGGGGFWVYRLAWAPNFKPDKTVYVYIDDKKDFDDLCRQLRDSANCLRIGSFKQLSGLLKYPASMRTGRYAVKPGMSNLTLLNDLRRGHQVAARVTFNNIRFKEDLAERISDQLMFGKENLLRLLNDSVYCDSLGFTPETIDALFIPNTYEIYWNISADKFIRRMKREYGTIEKGRGDQAYSSRGIYLGFYRRRGDGGIGRISNRGGPLYQPPSCWYSFTGRPYRKVRGGGFFFATYLI